MQRMNGEKDSIKIGVNLSPNSVLPEFFRRSSESKNSFLLCKWIREVREFAAEDTNRITFSLKAGLAMLLVSLLVLITAPFEALGANIIWSILTVGIMFEYTVGATLYRGFNRAVGSFIAGVFAIVVIRIAFYGGDKAAPYIIGLSIFLVGAGTSFMKLWPSLVTYEYGFRVILFTYCLIIVSSYRTENPMKTAMDRLYSISIGAVVTVLVNVLAFPIWAGEQLHKELVSSFNTVADSLEECVRKYLRDDGSGHCDFSKTVVGEFPDEQAFQLCRATLNSSARFDSLAPYNLRMAFHSEIVDAAIHAAELLRVLGSDISNMKHTLQTLTLIKSVHTSAYHLQHSMQLHSYLLTSPQLHLLNSTKKPTTDTLSNALSLADHEHLSYHDHIMKKQQRRLHSWPSIEVDELEEDGGIDTEMIPKMRTLESTTALSLATFTSLLIEFVARLDRLVDAVDELSKLARFKQEDVGSHS